MSCKDTKVDRANAMTSWYSDTAGRGQTCGVHLLADGDSLNNAGIGHEIRVLS
jgi:hypothetical protein